MIGFSYFFSQESVLERVLRVVSTLGAWWSIWLPVLLGFIFYETWMNYVRTKHVFGMKPVLLEIRPPKEVLRSPASMELFLQYLHQPFSGTFLDVYLKGMARAWFSLEIVSLGGRVKFFIWVPSFHKNMVESQLYAQFPDMEIYEAKDYAVPFHYDPSVTTINGGQLALTKADPYPIKTYIDYGLDRDPKEEYKIDPLTPLIEFLGSLKPTEQAWVQILVRAHKEEKITEHRLRKKKDWKDAAKKEIEKIVKESVFAPKGDAAKTTTIDYGKLAPGEKEAIEAIGRSLNKLAFDTMIRVVYLAPKEVFNSATNGALVGAFKAFSSQNLNGFKKKWPSYDYRWQDPRKKKEQKNKRYLIDAYKRRSFFEKPYKNLNGTPFILNTEELATLFHFPSQQVAATPSFERTLSRKSEPPANLPV